MDTKATIWQTFVCLFVILLSLNAFAHSGISINNFNLVFPENGTSENSEGDKNNGGNATNTNTEKAEVKIVDGVLYYNGMAIDREAAILLGLDEYMELLDPTKEENAETVVADQSGNDIRVVDGTLYYNGMAVADAEAARLLGLEAYMPKTEAKTTLAVKTNAITPTINTQPTPVVKTLMRCENINRMSDEEQLKKIKAGIIFNTIYSPEDDIRMIDGVLFKNGIEVPAGKEQAVLTVGTHVPKSTEITRFADDVAEKGMKSQEMALADTPMSGVYGLNDDMTVINGTLHLNNKPITEAVHYGRATAASPKSEMMNTSDITATEPELATAVNELIGFKPTGEIAAKTDVNAVNEKAVIAKSVNTPASTLPPLKKPTRVLLADIYNEEIPCHQHYGFNWDNKNIHAYKKYELYNMPDTVEFFLTHGLNDDFCMPIMGTVTSDFGPRRYRYHNGIDIRLRKGDPVRAIFKGKVRIAQYSSSYGYVVVVRHFNGLETLYAHLSKLKVKEGDDVEAGGVVGLGGSTGRSTGNHLHFEVRYKGHPINPNQLIDFNANHIKSHTFVVDKSYFSSSSPYQSAHGDDDGHSHAYVPTPSERQYHTIRSGETLYRIANKYGTSVNRLCKLNGMSTRTVLRVGKRLRVR